MFRGGGRVKQKSPPDLAQVIAEREYFRRESEKRRVKFEAQHKEDVTKACLLMGEVVRLRRMMEYDGDKIAELTKRAEKAEHELSKLKTWVRVKKISMVENYD